ncbi:MULTISPECIES: cytochrome P450 [unclassified Mycobacterium]|uniref:cytochrome P450 n=1 Tax=unclassified Mycobacterium TaxID=2642494 RepID=UPI0029C70C46|nr:MULTISPECIES: cytochrome P450 [unclassified Mycobacterium]
MTVLSDPLEFFGADALQDPYPLYDRLRAAGPVHRVGASAFYVVPDWAAVEDAIARVDDFSSNLTATMVYHPDGTVTSFEMDPLGGPTHVLATADDPAHAVHRRYLLPQLAAKRIRAAESFVTDTAELLWRDGVHGGRIEWMSAMANRLPMMVVARLIGVPDDDVDQLIAWSYAATQMLDGVVSADELAAAGTAAVELAGYIATHFDRAAADPQDNLLGDLATAVARGELDTVTAQLMMIILFGAGGESTASLIGNAAWILADRPDVQQRLRDDPDLLETFIEECLRYEPPFRGHYRHVRVDTTLGGVALPAGSHLLLLWGAVNRDPAHFDTPNEFRLDRAQAKGHLTFGKGAHFCVGAALARMEARIVLGMLLERTADIDAVDTGQWIPSILVRRRESLELAVR